MYNGNKYESKKAIEILPPRIRKKLWDALEELKSIENFPLDYIQSFHLSPIEEPEHSLAMQRIVHKQASPQYERIHFLPSSDPLTAVVEIVNCDDIFVMVVRSFEGKEGA